MNPTALAKRIRNFFVRLEIGANRALGRQFIPRDLAVLHIETSSACNLKCRFCAYVKKSTPRVSMQQDLFVECVTQAVALGYRRFELTPCTGDVFMDRHLLQKLAYLDEHPQVDAYQFFTNLTIPKPETVQRLSSFRKLKHVTVSVYGHDLDTFINIAGGTQKTYERLIANLDTLHAMKDSAPFRIAVGLRSTRRVPRQPISELLAALARMREAGIPVRDSRGVYNNWGGYITQEDVAGYDMHVTSTESTYKFGACIKLFDSVQVTATGVVNACACRDVDASLQIGDVRKTPLAEIVSFRNPAYLQIIDEQERGEFRPICRSCDFYKSIYHQRSEYRREGTKTRTLEELKREKG